MRNLKHLRNTKGQIWLNVASGHYTIEEFINLDNSIFLALLPIYPVIKYLLKRGHRKIIEEYKIAKSKDLLLFHDCRKRLRFPDDSVDHILCSHFLEHVYSEDAVKILKDFHRVLKLGGTLHIIVPNLKTLIDEYYANKIEINAADNLISKTLLSHYRKPSLVYRIFELFGYSGAQHRWMYDTESMTCRLRSIGFNILNTNNSPSRNIRLNDGNESIHILAEKLH